MAKTVTKFSARRVMDWLPEQVADLIEARCRDHIGDPELDIDVATRAYFDEVKVTFGSGQRIVVRFYVLDGDDELD